MQILGENTQGSFKNNMDFLDSIKPVVTSKNKDDVVNDIFDFSLYASQASCIENTYNLFSEGKLSAFEDSDDTEIHKNIYNNISKQIDFLTTQQKDSSISSLLSRHVSQLKMLQDIANLKKAPDWGIELNNVSLSSLVLGIFPIACVVVLNSIVPHNQTAEKDPFLTAYVAAATLVLSAISCHGLYQFVFSGKQKRKEGNSLLIHEDIARTYFERTFSRGKDFDSGSLKPVILNYVALRTIKQNGTVINKEKVAHTFKELNAKNLVSSYNYLLNKNPTDEKLQVFKENFSYLLDIAV